MNKLMETVIRNAAGRPAAAAVVSPSFSAAGTIGFSDHPTVATLIPIPASQSGKYAIAIIAGVIAGTQPSTPSGWGLIVTKFNNVAGGICRGTLFGRRLDGSEGANLSISTTGGESTIGGIVTFNNVKVATPFTAVGAGTNLASAGAKAVAHNPPDGAIAAGAALFSAVLVSENSTTCLITGGSGMTELLDFHTFSGSLVHRSICAALKASATAATIDPGTWTYNSTTGYGVSLDCQLNPV